MAKTRKLNDAQRKSAKEANARYEESKKEMNMKPVPVWVHVDDVDYIRKTALRRAKKRSILD